MLVLQRNTDEKIDITAPGGLPIVITVLESWSGGVRLGFEADPKVIVDRREVTELKKTSKEAGK